MRRDKTLQWPFHDHSDFIWLDKPSGWATHASDQGRQGIAEIVSELHGQKYLVVHRLDKGTSGVLLLAKNSDAAAKIAALFLAHEVQKTYLFLTDKPHPKMSGKIPAEMSFEVQSHIEKVGSQFVSTHNATPNAVTQFKFIKKTPLGYLWQAFPKTGKPHQIRLHALSSGIPILGDQDHQGKTFSRLALHAWKTSFPWKNEHIHCETTLPAWANDSCDHEQIPLQEALSNRQRIFSFHQHPNESLRLAHLDAMPWQLDRYGKQAWLSLFGKAPSDTQLQFFATLAKQLDVGLRVRLRQDRGQDPHSVNEWLFGPTETRWTAEENKVIYQFRADSGQSAGLFLDQRENRLWVRYHSLDKTVLNLFSYTGAFSLCAAMGGARQVTTVDVSKTFHDWAKENFRLNHLDPQLTQYQFFQQDVLLYLKGAQKRKRQWDLIICDPPSFGRSKDGTFQLAKDLPELLHLINECLAPQGILLFSCNYEKWDLAELEKLIWKSLSQHDWLKEPAPIPGMDFERPADVPVLKTILLQKK